MKAKGSPRPTERIGPRASRASPGGPRGASAGRGARSARRATRKISKKSRRQQRQRRARTPNMPPTLRVRQGQKSCLTHRMEKGDGGRTQQKGGRCCIAPLRHRRRGGASCASPR
eukprot:5513673-Pyramimonas_sp.AAC.1